MIAFIIYPYEASLHLMYQRSLRNLFLLRLADAPRAFPPNHALPNEPSPKNGHLASFEGFSTDEMVTDQVCPQEPSMRSFHTREPLDLPKRLVQVERKTGPVMGYVTMGPLNLAFCFERLIRVTRSG